MDPLKMVLTQLGIIGKDPSAAGLRMDSAATATIERQLRYVEAQTYDILYPELKARLFIPVSSRAGAGAKTVSYYTWDQVGMAKVISDYSDDLPLVDQFRTEHFQKVESLGVGYTFSVQELREAAMAGDDVNIDGRRGETCREVVERRVEQIAAHGDSVTGMPGFVNNSNVALVTLPTGSWASATPQQIREDIDFMVRTIRENSKGVHAPDTLLLDVDTFEILNNKYLSNDNDKTVLRAYIENSPYITGIDFWNELDEADAAGTGPRCVMYRREARLVELQIPQEFEQFPPQAKNLSFLVPCHARIGGVTLRYPLSMVYADNHA